MLVISNKIVRFEGILGDNRLEELLQGEPKIPEVRALLIRKL
jgi:hypothetical protein